ncbi:RNA 2',3'-cyclic phosphodiesterase [Magnetospira sp. QH-2]|uniref:RNA 2',3'-cyclic phosphodiesterase n=1 Tax=Magnetospira sp. (strain QH-2) TaxID=1288970 RepID=UPI0003E80C46|nr:RNA 2',3'-cyclic phosphodiesterase [Magnetospira sp. QH-2]CCQ75549.1 2'-5' RNA ligase [Magnetospira sp. QH-2]
MFRLFVGIPFPVSVQASLEGLCHGVPGVRWVQPHSFHMTLRFIGEVDEDVAEDLDAALAGIHAPRFMMALSGVGCFDKRNKVKALWAGADKSSPLMHLFGKVESAVVRAGMPPEPRKFKPHVTLARSRNLSLEQAAPFLESRSQYLSEAFEVSRFTLFRSHLSREGAFYEPLAEYPLT